MARRAIQLPRPTRSLEARLVSWHLYPLLCPPPARGLTVSGLLPSRGHGCAATTPPSRWPPRSGPAPFFHPTDPYLQLSVGRQRLRAQMRSRSCFYVMCNTNQLPLTSCVCPTTWLAGGQTTSLPHSSGNAAHSVMGPARALAHSTRPHTPQGAQVGKSDQLTKDAAISRQWCGVAEVALVLVCSSRWRPRHLGTACVQAANCQGEVYVPYSPDRRRTMLQWPRGGQGRDGHGVGFAASNHRSL